MTECCWYKTDVSTLWRYAKNSVKHIASDRDAALEDLLKRAWQTIETKDETGSPANWREDAGAGAD